jgi:phage terminase large subunit
MLFRCSECCTLSGHHLHQLIPGCDKRFGTFVLRQPGTLVVCIREKQMKLAQSSKRLIEDKIAAFGVGNGFRIYDEKIKTPGDGLIIFQGMQDHTAESIKSLEGFRIAWIDEAQALRAHRQ